MRRFPLLPLALILVSAAESRSNEAPVLGSAPSNMNVPGGKSVVVPLTATDPDGDRLTYTVSSSSAGIIARVKSGFPFLRLNVTHASSGGSDSAFAGTIALALFHDWTPLTADTIAGLAQAGFYDGTIFHRILVSSTVAIAQGGGKESDVNYQASFKLPAEFKPQLIFSGTAQIALANQTNDTNSSQFFLTRNPQRPDSADPTNSVFDFNFTIFGQATRGADLIQSTLNTPRSSNSDGSGMPDSPVNITSATINPDASPGSTDAVLLLSAPGTDAPATITVTATDPDGLSATQTFTATPITDTADDPPFLAKLPKDQTVGRNTVVKIPLSLIDLDYDPMEFVASPVTGTSFPAKLQSAVQEKFVLLLTAPSFRGAINLRIGRRQTGAFERGNRQLGDSFFDIDDDDVFNISIGDGSYSVKPAPIEATKGVALTNIVVAKLVVIPPSDAKPVFIASINWGDNTLTSGALEKSATGYNIKGTHTYARGGSFPVSVTVRDQFTVTKTVNGVDTTSTVFGAKKEAYFNAYVLDAATAPIIVRGETLELPKIGKFSGNVAAFTDAAHPDAAAGAYSAVIDWGDGKVTAGKIKSAAGGKFTVSSDHVYADADDYSLGVQIAHTSSVAGSGYSRLHVGGTQKSLPPFRNVDLQGEWLALNVANTGTGAELVGKVTGQFKVKNTGKLKSAPAVVTFYYSTNLYAGEANTANANGQDDVSLKQLQVPALDPGKSMILTLSAKEGATSEPLSLPAGVDFSTDQALNIVTNLHATHVAPLIIDVDHNLVNRPFKK